MTELVGENNITTDGYFGEIITIDDSSMVLTNGNPPHYLPGETGKSYPGAIIDFKGLDDGTYEVDNLIAMGFNSTCKTCSNHYSIVFTDGGSESKTEDGYGYTKKQIGSDYTLWIDISSLKDKGKTSAKDFTEAIVKIASECFDFHFTQYASDGISKLYIYDNREQSSPAQAATFDTFPFNAIDADEFKFTMATDDGRGINLNYGYCYGDFADNIVVEMRQDDVDGTYVKIDDGNGEYHYEEYDAANPDHAGISERYALSVSYLDVNGASVSREDAEASYADYALNKMLGSSTIQLNACKYTEMTMGGNENENVAIRSFFDSKMLKEEVDNGIIIRCSAQDGDRVSIPRFGVNTFSLKLYKAGTKTQEEAEQTITITKKALSLLSERRSAYGAMQNRLEHTYNIRANVEENTQAAESRLRDADIANEILLFSNQNILVQAGMSMLAQANSSQDFLMQLLQ